MMRITWVMRSFLDYRIILYKTLAMMPDVEFTLLSSQEHVPESVRAKTVAALGDRVEFLAGEKCFGKPYSPEQRSNSARRIFWQPGLRKKILATKPDVVITDAFNHWTLPVLWLRRHHNFKHIVCYERTAHTERTAPWLKRKFIQFAGRYVDAVHYNGVLCHDFLRELGYPEYKLMPGNMTVDILNLAATAGNLQEEDRKTLRAQWGISDETVFLFIGRLIPCKGLSPFLGGWRQWHREHPDTQVKFLIVGSGQEEDRLKAYCRENNLDDVIFAGKSSYEDIPKYFAMSDVFVIPTLEDNWSLVVPEAMACGKPILCSCYNGCHPELVHPENGWVFDPLNENDIEAKLDAVYQSRDKYLAMGEVSRKLVALFSPEEIASSIYRTCREKIQKPKLPLIPAVIEKARSAFDWMLQIKVHWGCVTHYRKMMKLNHIPNKEVEGEKEYVRKWSPLSSRIAKEDYRLFRAYIDGSADIVPESVSHNIVEAILVPGKYRAVYSDKNMFDMFMPKGSLAKTYLRCMQGVFRSEDYSTIKPENIDLVQRLKPYSRCIVKPSVDSSSGHGVTVFEQKNDDFYALNGGIKGEKMTLNVLQRFFGNDFIVQEYLEQCDFMKKLCSTSVNTIRLFIYRSVKTEEVVVPAIIMRLGHEGALVDNSHAGGVSIGVSHNGVLGKYTTDQYGQRYTVVNGIDFEHTEWQIPRFERVLEFAKEVGNHLLHARMANIDVMLDKNGDPRLVEYNLNSMSTWLYQFDSGLAYGEYTDEIIDYCSKNLGKVSHINIEY